MLLILYNYNRNFTYLKYLLSKNNKFTFKQVHVCILNVVYACFYVHRLSI